MTNPAQDWTSKVKLKTIQYHDFPLNAQSSYYFCEKINGMNCCLVYKRKETPYFITRVGKTYTHFLCLKEYHDILFKHPEIESIYIPGELAAVNSNGEILPWNELMHTIKSSWKDEKLNRLVHHYPFDVFKINGKSIRFDKAISLLQTLFSKCNLIHPVRCTKGNLYQAWNTYIDTKGVEGIVARSSTSNYRIKKSYDADLVLLGIGNKKAINWNKGMISYLIVAFTNKNNDYILTSRIGTGYTHQESFDIFKWVKKNKIFETEQEVFVKPENVVEISFKNAFLAKNRILKFRNNKYIETGIAVTFNLFQPSFVRFRPDKEPDYPNTSLKQITKFFQKK